MKFKKIICPCCHKEVDIPLGKYSTGFDFDYSILLNSTEEFFDLVDICPECGYAMLFDNGAGEEMCEFVRSEQYRNILHDPDMEDGLKKWILLAMLSELDEKFTEAGIEYTKAYDYLVLKGMSLDKNLLKKAAACFLAAVEEADNDANDNLTDSVNDDDHADEAAEEYVPFTEAFLAVDCLRRAGDFETASALLEAISETFEGELTDRVIWKEKMWLDLRIEEKRILDI
ncbi:MAG: hypothetical protein Q4E57_02490 [Eubacteriales bacterium]|nr:hypothetical protein [Eubacteriales bacterium]